MFIINKMSDRKLQIINEKVYTVFQYIDGRQDIDDQSKQFLKNVINSVKFNNAFYNFITCNYAILCNKVKNRKIVIDAMTNYIIENRREQLQSAIGNSSFNSIEEYAKNISEGLLDSISTGGKQTINFKGKISEIDLAKKRNLEKEKELEDLKLKLKNESCKTLSPEKLNLKYNNNKTAAEAYISSFNRRCTSFWDGPQPGNPFAGGSYISKKRAQRASPKYPAKSKKHQIIEGNKKGQFYESRADKNGVFRWYKVKM